MRRAGFLLIMMFACSAATAFAEAADDDAPTSAPAVDGAPTRPPARPPVRTVVRETSEIEPVASIGVGRRQGLGLGDRVAVLDAGATSIVAAGDVFVLDDEAAAVRMAAMPPTTWREATAFVVTAGCVADALRRMPAGATLRAKVADVGPGRRQVWIDVGRLAGLSVDDWVWVLRDDFPVARGRVVDVLERTALVQCRPLVSDASPRRGDAVELWPAPAMVRSGRLETRALDAKADEEGVVVRLAGAAREGLRAGRTLELFSGDEYVGQATVTTTGDRLSEAKCLQAFCTTQPVAGVRAIARPPPGHESEPLEGVVFAIRDGYASISVGHADGVRLGDAFVVRRDGRTIARLVARKVNVDFSGADIEPVGDSPSEVRVWDRIARVPLPPDPVHPVAVVREVSRGGEWLVADVDAPGGRALVPGDALRIPGRVPGAAIVVHREENRLFLYVPPGWSMATTPPGTRLEYVSDSA